MKVAVITAFYEPAYKGGGPIQTLRALVNAAPYDCLIAVICSNADLGDPRRLVSEPNTWLRVRRAKVRYVEGGLVRLIAAFRSARGADLVYLNSFFEPRYAILPLALHLLGFWRSATVLLAPRGELNEGALALKSAKKRLYIGVFRTLRLHERVLWHGSSSEEKLDVERVFGPRSTVLVRENETSLPPEAGKRTDRSGGVFRLLFASRAVPKKGLLTLLRALAQMEPQRLHLDVVGGFEDSQYEAACRDVVRTLPNEVSVIFHGAHRREVVLEFMRSADLFALPTAGENFGHVIAEALSESCTVMCSNFTPWSKTLSGGGGVVVSQNTPEAWAEALHAYVVAGPERWRAGHQLATRAYDQWRSASKGDHVFERARIK